MDQLHILTLIVATGIDMRKTSIRHIGTACPMCMLGTLLEPYWTFRFVIMCLVTGDVDLWLSVQVVWLRMCHCLRILCGNVASLYCTSLCKLYGCESDQTYRSLSKLIQLVQSSSSQLWDSCAHSIFQTNKQCPCSYSNPGSTSIPTMPLLLLSTNSTRVWGVRGWFFSADPNEGGVGRRRFTY